ncbi:rhodanese-like domain-containing protein [Pseudobacillus badius]|uniref:rhodanese-like domain-containing protein n=1 Tax=Bacillus badius TaxID=1455 RepID=UPI0007B0B975|nr:rhodanese-like domain-containing protein [Bacillus badius]KZN99072.1 sulfurtransferase [Bacillus badius]OCS84010.1 sulfurtransferase [Bacillus badius]OVE52694.1 sulfurtransferase [Bacillus badius]TDW04709.1 rhodanese-related sulfurtransferase [Bacillus badius]GLY09685.1 rhodanese-like domain-containing protein [Bacillus badius]
MFPEILPEEAERLLQEHKNICVLDVREAGEVAAGKIPGAVHLPLGQVLTRAKELDPDKEYIVVCRSGNRSSLACEWLTEKGLKVKNMTGGMNSWTGAAE